MENLLNQMEPQAREALQALVNKLVQQFEPEKIICFGFNAFNTVNHTAFTEIGTTQQLHFFLLVVTAASARIEHDIQSYASHHFRQGKVTVLAHGNEAIAKAIRQQSRFYSTVFSQGTLLYVASGHVPMDVPPSPCPRKTAEKTRQKFCNRFDLAIGFARAAKSCLESEHYNCAVFLMHQVVEQSCRALIRVHMAYRSDIHHLGRLLDLCSCFSQEPARVFAGNTPEDARLFTLLTKSYLEGRYKDEFSIEEEDARLLYRKVQYFVELTKRLCFQKIEALDALAMQEVVPPAPVVEELIHTL